METETQCRICGTLTALRHTEKCNNCWEVISRLPTFAQSAEGQKILKSYIELENNKMILKNVRAHISRTFTGTLEELTLPGGYHYKNVQVSGFIEYHGASHVSIDDPEIGFRHAIMEFREPEQWTAGPQDIPIIRLGDWVGWDQTARLQNPTDQDAEWLLAFTEVSEFHVHDKCLHIMKELT